MGGRGTETAPERVVEDVAATVEEESDYANRYSDESDADGQGGLRYFCLRYNNAQSNAQPITCWFIPRHHLSIPHHRLSIPPSPVSRLHVGTPPPQVTVSTVEEWITKQNSIVESVALLCAGFALSQGWCVFKIWGPTLQTDSF